MGEILEGYFPRDLLGVPADRGVAAAHQAGPADAVRAQPQDRRGDLRLLRRRLALVGGEQVDLAPMDALRVAPDTQRAFAAGPDGLELLVFGTHHDDDAVLDESPWD